MERVSIHITNVVNGYVIEVVHGEDGNIYIAPDLTALGKLTGVVIKEWVKSDHADSASAE